jgi:hypothetical protein
MQYSKGESKGEARRHGHDSINAMRAKEKKMGEDLKQFMETLQQTSSNDNEALNEIKEDQKTFTPTSNPQAPSQLMPHQALSAFHTSAQADLISFLHAAAGYPVPSKLVKAINKGHSTTWPGLSSQAIREHLPKSIATVKGHLNQQ